MSSVETETKCIKCKTPLTDGKCVNADCDVAQSQWSSGGIGDAAKASAVHAQERPAAWTRSGRVD